MLELSSNNTILSFSKENKPAVSVKSGDSINIETIDAFAGQIKKEEDKLEAINWECVNPATGPVYIEDAKPGDVLKVTIEKIEVENKGVIATGEDMGLLGERLKGRVSRIVPIENGEIIFDDKLKIPQNTMIGVIGVAPLDKPANCGTPGSHGGNMDNKMVTEGASLYFPVFVEGALFAMGDMHASMGDGEIGVTGAEVAGRAVVKFEVIKGMKLNNPLLENDRYISTIASADTLDAAVEQAASDMADIAVKGTGMALSEVIMLLSLVGQAQICQVVDPLKTARFLVPKYVLGKYGFRIM